MTYKLAIGDRMYSSWSLRGWLLFEPFDVHVNVRMAFMKTPDFSTVLEEFQPSLLVPAMRNGDVVVWDSLAMAETLAEDHPDAGYWPTDPAQRAMARSMVAEMHSGFTALRGACPMNLRQTYVGFEPDAAVLADIARLERLWALPNIEGPWLFGSFSVVDAFFAPVAARLAGYDLPMSDFARAYVNTHLANPHFRRWRAMAFAADMKRPNYEFDLAHSDWTGPKVLPAKPVENVTTINSTCPYSGKEIAPNSLAEINGRYVGFCNQFCRDKSVADAEAWPKLMDLLETA